MIRLYAGITVICIGILYTLGGFTVIDPGEVGLKIKMLGSDRGVEKTTLDTGTHWIDPITYDVAIYDTRKRQQGITDLPSQTRDGQPILVDISLEIGLTDAGVPNLHENIGSNYFEQVVYPALRAAVRNNTSRLDSDEIYTGKGRNIVQMEIEKTLGDHLVEYGIILSVNLRAIDFVNAGFVQALENKALTAQSVIIKKRQAEAAVNEAIRVANIAEGKKQKAIKEAEAKSQAAALEGIGLRKKKEQEAKGILAIARAKAEGTRLQVLAYGSGKTYASVQWAKNLAPKLQIWGVPTGAPGTSSLMDINGILKGAFQVPSK